MARTTFTLDDDLKEWVESRIVPGQSEAHWYRYAAKTMVQVEPILDELYERHEYEKRQEFIEAAVKEKVDEVMDQNIDKSHENITDRK